MANEDKFSKTIDDEQLDEVAGGTKAELQKDIKFFNAIGKDLGLNDLDEGSSAEDVAEYWKAAGVGYQKIFSRQKPNSYKSNSYELCYNLKNVEISRQDAMIEAMRATGKFVDLDRYL